MLAHNLKEETINEFIPVVEKTVFGKDIDDKFRLTIAIGLYVNNDVTLAGAAELAGRNLNSFIEILCLNKIAWGEYSEEYYKQDKSALKKFSELRAGSQ